MPRESLAEAVARLRAAVVRTPTWRGAASPLARARADGAPDRGDPPHRARRAHLRLGRLLAELDDPSLAPPAATARRGRLPEEVTLLWQTDEVRSLRPHVVDEIRHGPLVLRVRACSEAAPSSSLADYRGSCRPPRSVALRHLDRRRPGRQPGGGPSTVEAALERARTPGARDVYSRRGPRARAGDRDLERARRRRRGAPGLDRPRRGGARRVRGGDRRIGTPTEPYRRKLSHLATARQRAGRGGAATTPRRRSPPTSSMIDRASLRGARRAGRRRPGRRPLAPVEIFGLHLAKLDLRAHATRCAGPERLHETLEAVARP